LSHLSDTTIEGEEFSSNDGLASNGP